MISGSVAHAKFVSMMMMPAARLQRPGGMLPRAEPVEIVEHLEGRRIPAGAVGRLGLAPRPGAAAPRAGARRAGAPPPGRQRLMNVLRKSRPAAALAAATCVSTSSSATCANRAAPESTAAIVDRTGRRRVDCPKGRPMLDTSSYDRPVRFVAAGSGSCSARPTSSNCPPAAGGGGGRGGRSGAGRETDHWLFVGARAASAAARAGRRPAVASRAVLHHPRVGADGVAVQVLRAGVAVGTCRIQRGVVHLDDRVLIPRIVLAPAGEAGQIVVAEDHDIDAVRRGDLFGHRHALERLDHDGHEHVVVDRLAIVEPGVQSWP